MAYCKNCGTQLKEGAKFCPNCGQSTGFVAKDPQVRYENVTPRGKDEGLSWWKKGICFLLGFPSMLIAVIFWGESLNLRIHFTSRYLGYSLPFLLFWVKKENQKAKDMFLWGLLGLIVYGFLVAEFGSGSKDSISKTAQEIMISDYSKKGSKLEIREFSLVHESGNHYTGIAEVVLDGEKMKLDVNVISDGETVQVNWEPSAEYLFEKLSE